MGILRNDGQILDHGGRDDEAVEGVAMMERESTYGEKMRSCDGELFECVPLQSRHESRFEGFGQFQFSQRLLDRHLPNTGIAQKIGVRRQFNRFAGPGAEARIAQ